MDDRIRERMHRALELKGLNHYEVSERAGLHKNYLWASFNPKRRKGNINDYKRISDMIGLNFTWLLTEEGEPFGSVAAEVPLDRAAILMALEAVLEDLLRLDRAQARHGALTILDIAEHPPDGSSSTDIESRIRNGILGWLRGYEHR